jgi:ribose-phosphate pyrophosphokinase
MTSLDLRFKQALLVEAEASKKVDPYARSRNNEPIQDADRFVIISGNSSPELAQSIAKHLGTDLAEGKVRQFADGEINVQFAAKDVSGRDCYIVQPTQRPVNDNLMELIFMVSACRRAGARSVTVVTPYYGYARQDRRFDN